MRQRWHDILFSVLVAAVLLATGWSLSVRDPELFRWEGSSVPARRGGAAAPPERGAQGEGESRPSATERMIEEGRLSGHPARHYQKVEP